VIIGLLATSILASLVAAHREKTTIVDDTDRMRGTP
jgi:hypothetical protein